MIISKRKQLSGGRAAVHSHIFSLANTWMKAFSGLSVRQHNVSAKAVQCVLISSCRRYQSHMQLLFLLWGFCHWFHFVLAYVKCIVKPLQCRQMCHIQMQPQHIMYRITTSKSIKFFFLMSLFWNIMFVFTFWDFLFARRDLWFLQHVTPDSVLHLVPISRSEKHIEAVRFLGFLHPMQVIWSEVDIFRPVSSHLALNASRAISCDHSSLPHSLCKYTPTPSFTGTNKCVFSTRNNYLNV